MQIQLPWLTRQSSVETSSVLWSFKNCCYSTFLHRKMKEVHHFTTAEGTTVEVWQEWSFTQAPAQPQRELCCLPHYWKCRSPYYEWWTKNAARGKKGKMYTSDRVITKLNTLVKNEYFIYISNLDAAWSSSYEFLLITHFSTCTTASITHGDLHTPLPSSDSGRQCHRPSMEWWGRREPSRGAQLKKKGKTMHYSYKIWQDNKAAFLNPCVSGFGNNPNLLFFSSRKWNLWKKCFPGNTTIKNV